MKKSRSIAPKTRASALATAPKPVARLAAPTASVSAAIESLEGLRHAGPSAAGVLKAHVQALELELAELIDDAEGMDREAADREAELVTRYGEDTAAILAEHRAEGARLRAAIGALERKFSGTKEIIGKEGDSDTKTRVPTEAAA